MEKGEIKLEYAGAHQAPRGCDYPPHSHNCWELVLYRKGNIEMHLDDKIYPTFPGLMICTPPGVTHSEIALTAYANFFISVHISPDKNWPIAVIDDDAGTLKYLCRALVDHFRRRSDPFSASMLPLILAQLDCFLQHQSRQVPLSRAEETVRAAERILEERYQTSVEIRKVARELGVASSALRGYFTSCRGYTPSEALARLRLQCALSLLRSSDLPLKEVARSSGYYSPSHLTRHIKTATRQTPGQWRNNHAQ